MLNSTDLFSCYKRILQLLYYRKKREGILPAWRHTGTVASTRQADKPKLLQ